MTDECHRVRHDVSKRVPIGAVWSRKVAFGTTSMYTDSQQQNGDLESLGFTICRNPRRGLGPRRELTGGVR